MRKKTRVMKGKETRCERLQKGWRSHMGGSKKHGWIKNLLNSNTVHKYTLYANSTFKINFNYLKNWQLGGALEVIYSKCWFQNQGTERGYRQNSVASLKPATKESTPWTLDGLMFSAAHPLLPRRKLPIRVSPDNSVKTRKASVSYKEGHLLPALLHKS